VRPRRDSRCDKKSRRSLRSKGGEIHGREVHQKTHLERGIFFERARHFEQELAADKHHGISAVGVRTGDRMRETVFDSLNERRGRHRTSSAGLLSGSGRVPLAPSAWIFAASSINASRTYSGRGGQPWVYTAADRPAARP